MGHQRIFDFTGIFLTINLVAIFLIRFKIVKSELINVTQARKKRKVRVLTRNQTHDLSNTGRDISGNSGHFVGSQKWFEITIKHEEKLIFYLVQGFTDEISIPVKVSA